MSGPRVVRGVRVPMEARLPVVVTDEWLAAVVEAGWCCRCQHYGDRARCTHVGWCTKGATDGLTVDEAGRVLCLPCAQVRARRAAADQRDHDRHLMAAAQTSILDLTAEES